MTYLLDIATLSKQLGVSKGTIYDWCAFGKMPHIKLGKFIRFDPKEIAEWVQKKKKRTRII